MRHSEREILFEGPEFGVGDRVLVAEGLPPGVRRGGTVECVARGPQGWMYWVAIDPVHPGASKLAHSCDWYSEDGLEVLE